MPDTSKLEQETASLRKINDYFKRVIITHDDIISTRTAGGIVILNLQDFLLNPDSLNAL